jgi:repressor LexA
VSRLPTDTLSPRQRRIIEFLREYRRTHSYPPSIREIGRGAGINSTSVVDHNLNVLAKLGFLRRASEISRGIEILDHEEVFATIGTVAAPIVGLIAAGEPIEAVAAQSERIVLTSDLASEDSFVLRVKGKSMIEDLIDDGDLVVVRPQATAENGDIVVALIVDSPTGEGQATLKRFYRERERVRLQPANATMEPIYVDPAHLRIQGKVTAVIRQLG